MSAYPTLFSPITVAGLSLANRVVMPPMASAMDVTTDQFRCWYEARARGGVGLVIMEAFSVGRLLRDEFCEALKPTVEAIHGHGVPVVLQLFQPPQTPEGEAIWPSKTHDRRAATEEELAAIAPRFAAVAGRCKAVEFDGVEPHGAHGFFLNQMFSRFNNRRDDRYGGSLEKRMTLGLEIVAAIRAEVGAGYPIFYRHTAEEPDGYTVADSVEYLGRLMEAGVDVLDISPAMRAKDHAAIAAEVKAQLSAPVIAVGGMEVAEWAEAALELGKCDLCAVGRQLIADADWPMKVRDGREDEIVHCTKCDIRCFGNLRDGIPIGCEENAASGNEYRMV